jgi:uncharacterized protein (TIGR02246 family)
LSQAPTGESVERARRAIEAARNGFVAAMRRSDVAGLVAHYDEEAIVVPQTSDLCRGIGAIEKLFASWLTSSRIREFAVETEDLRILDDVAIEVGTYRMVLEETGSARVNDEGKFLIVYVRKPDGTWRISRDISSSSKR